MFLFPLLGTAMALDCPQQLTREDIDEQITLAETAYADIEVEAFRDRMNELNGLLLPCIGDLLPGPAAARTHRLLSLQQLELGNDEAAAASWSAVPRLDPDLPLPEAWLPADHPLRSVAPDTGRTRRAPEPRSGHLAFDGVTSRDRPKDAPTIAQRFDAAGVAVSTAYLAADDPLPPYEAIPRTRNRLMLGAAGAGVAGLATLTASWLQYRSLLANAADPTVPAADLDRQRATSNATYGIGAGLVGIGVGLGVGAVVVGPR